eukprot:3644344-Amphidinium_carterae.1
MIVCDASPWGLGAVLTHWRGQPLEYFASRVTEDDARLLAIDLGSSASQAVLEALCILVALRRWGKHLKHQHAGLQVRTDNLASVFTLQRLASASPRMNFIAAETAIYLEASQIVSYEMKHIAGSFNVTADALSRRFAPTPVPQPDLMAKE